MERLLFKKVELWVLGLVLVAGLIGVTVPLITGHRYILGHLTRHCALNFRISTG